MAAAAILNLRESWTLDHSSSRMANVCPPYQIGPKYLHWRARYGRKKIEDGGRRHLKFRTNPICAQLAPVWPIVKPV